MKNFNKINDLRHETFPSLGEEMPIKSMTYGKSAECNPVRKVLTLLSVKSGNPIPSNSTGLKHWKQSLALSD
jgi:hypothetical protein